MAAKYMLLLEVRPLIDFSQDLLLPVCSAKSSRSPIEFTNKRLTFVLGDIPSYKIFESDLSFAFLDIGPLSKGHALVIPKYHAEKMHELPDEHLSDVLPIAKKIAIAQGVPDYNVLQNNGRLAHQEVAHVHFHVIPKPNAEEGLSVGWPAKPLPKEEMQRIFDEIKEKIAAKPDSSL